MTTLTAANPTLGGPPMAVGSAPSFGAAPSGGITPADFFRVVRQRMLMIVLLGILLSGLAVGAVLFWYVKYPGYRAQSLIRVTSLKPRGLVDTGNERFDNKEIEREIQNQVFRVTSPTVLDNVLKNPDFRRLVWHKEALEDDESEFDLLKDAISVSPIRDSTLISVTALWRIPDEVDRIVNTVVSEYMKVINDQSRAEIRIQSDELRSALDLAARKFQDKKNEITRFMQTSELSGFGNGIDMEVAELTSRKTELEVMVSALRANRDQMQSMQPGDVPINEEMQQLLAADQDLFRLQSQVIEAERIYDLQKRRFLDNHTTVKTAKAAFETAQEKLSVARAQKIVQFQQRRIEEAESTYERANQTLVEVKEKLNVALSNQRDKQDKLALYEGLLEERDLLHKNYERLLTEQSKVEEILRQSQTVRIDVASTAVPPKRISSPNLKMFLPLGVIAGFGLSVGLALLIDLTDKSVRTAKDVSRAQLPVLGTIPTTDDDEVEIERVETACLDAPHSVVAEAFRSLRANLFFSAPAEQQGVILVTSPSGGNGKTTVSSNLAISIALSGRRVLLIDANLRRPSLPTIFPGMRSEGLSNILIGQGQLRDYVCDSPIPGLDLLGAGPMPPNPAELLGSSYLRDIIVDARSRYDQVIFDGPPVLLVSDAMVLAGAVDGCLLVCQYRQTSRGALQRTRFNLDAINARIFGAVLNEVESRRGGYFRKSYREFYEYQEMDDEDNKRPTLDVSAGYQSRHSDQPGDGGPRGSGGGAISVVRGAASHLDKTMADFEDDPAEAADDDWPDSDTETTVEDAVAVVPKAPEVDTGPGLDLGSLPDLSDLDSLDVRVDVDLDSQPSKPASTSSSSSADDQDAPLDLDALADELEELESDEFRIDDRFDLGDDDLGDDATDEKR